MVAMSEVRFRFVVILGNGEKPAEPASNQDSLRLESGNGLALYALETDRHAASFRASGSASLGDFKNRCMSAGTKSHIVCAAVWAIE